MVAEVILLDTFFENFLVVFLGTLFSAIVGPILALYVGFGYFKKKAPKWYDSLVGLINRGNIEKTFKKLNKEGLSDETAKFLTLLLPKSSSKSLIW